MPRIRSPIPASPKQDKPPVPFGLGELGPLNTGGDMTRPERFRADRVISDVRQGGNDRRLAQQSRYAGHQRARNWIRDRDSLESGADFGLGDLGPTHKDTPPEMKVSRGARGAQMLKGHTAIELFKEFVENNTMPQLSSFNMPTMASEMPMEMLNSSMKDIALPESPRKEDGDVKMVTEAVMKQGDASADQAMAIGREWLQNLIYQPGETIPFYNLGRDTIGKLFGQLPASAVQDITFDEEGYPSHKGKPMTEQHIKQLFEKVSSHPAYSQVQEAGRKAKGAEIPEMPQGETVTAMQKFLYMGGVLKAEEAIPEFIPHPAGLKDADGNPIMIRNEAFKKDFFPQPAVGEGITPQDASGFTERLDTFDPDLESGAGTPETASRWGATKKRRRSYNT